MENAAKKFANLLLVLGLIAFLLIGFFGISHYMGMQTRSDGTMEGCLFMGMEKICKMTFVEHLNQWQSIFTAITSQKALVLVLLILIPVVFVAVAILKRNLLLLFRYYIILWRLYIRRNPHLSLFNDLKEAFSQGILNPKIY